MHSGTDTKKSSILFPVVEFLLLVLLAAGIGSFFYFRQSLEKIREVTPSAADFTLCEAAIESRKEEINTYTLQSRQKYQKAEVLLTENQNQYAALAAEKEALSAQISAVEEDLKLALSAQEEANKIRKDYGNAVRQLEEQILSDQSPYRICYLTFDDGPSYYTGDFLDKLDELGIPATFFTIGCEMETRDYDVRDSLLRREAASGHTIANHTYSHAYNQAYSGSIYESTRSFMDAIARQDELIYSVTGFHSEIVRFPAGSNFCPQKGDTVKALHEKGYAYVDWTANAYDAGFNGYSADYTASLVVRQVEEQKIAVVLMHDWVWNTMLSLEKIVPPLQEQGYVFLPMFPSSVTMQS